ncbi:MAG: CPBP family intramembrane metalloprotease [Ignavibacteriae bacterium]|nr:CPBP family intramembrane metalloprotease [Ignavibacteriota bacterium]MCB9217612.1 CPBP family intramembrane metalloprotease [Ignavibacteria bacterium]
MNKSNLSPFSFGWLSVIIVIVTYLVGGGLIMMVAADSISTVTGKIEISSRNFLLSVAIGQILFMLLPALFIAQIHPLGTVEALRIRAPKVSHVIMIVLGIAACYFLSEAWITAQELYMIPDALRPMYEEAKGETSWITEKLIVGKDIPMLILAFFSVAIVPACSEEVLFRGIAQRSFEDRLKPFAAIMITGLLFGLIHMEPTNIVPLIGLGLFFGFMAWASRSIWPVIIGHMLFNGTQVLLVNLHPELPLLQQEMKNSPVPEDLTALLPVAAVALLIMVGIIIWMRKDRLQSLSEDV